MLQQCRRRTSRPTSEDTAGVRAGRTRSILKKSGVSGLSELTDLQQSMGRVEDTHLIHIFDSGEIRWPNWKIQIPFRSIVFFGRGIRSSNLVQVEILPLCTKAVCLSEWESMLTFAS